MAVGHLDFEFQFPSCREDLTIRLAIAAKSSARTYLYGTRLLCYTYNVAAAKFLTNLGAIAK